MLSSKRLNALIQASPRPLSPLWQSSVITLAVGCQPFGRVTTAVPQSRQSRLCGRMSLSAEEFGR